jgi:ABC-type branched-subunit amino acid transport system substrate-binding protein
MKPKLLLALMLAALLVVVPACGGDDDEVADDETPAEDVQFDLRVGVVTSFTGDLSAFGQPIDRAVRLGAEVITEAIEEVGLENVSVEVADSQDDQTQATAGVEAATALVQTQNVQLIVGSLASAVTIPIAESVTGPNQVVQISPASTSPAITDLDDNGFLWRTAPSDALQGQVLADAMAEEFGADATVNTGARNDAYGVALTEQFEQAWEAGGGTIGQSVRWNPEAATFDTEAGQLTSGNPGAWMIIDFPETWARMGPALVRAGGWDPERTFTADGLRNTELPQEAGEQATDGMRGTAPTSEGAPAGEAFATLWEDRVDISRQTFDAQAFDAIIVGFLAAVRAGSSESAQIRDNMQAVSGPPGNQYTFEQLGDAIQALLNGEDIDYQGASGPLDFDDNGDPGAAIYEIWQFQGGAIETQRTVDFGTDNGNGENGENGENDENDEDTDTEDDGS